MMASLVNTAGEPDELATLADLDAFLTVWVFTGRVDRDEAELAALRRLRARLAGFFDVDEEGYAVLLVTGEVPAELEEKAKLCADNCPEFAIEVEADPPS